MAEVKETYEIFYNETNIYGLNPVVLEDKRKKYFIKDYTSADSFISGFAADVCSDFINAFKPNYDAAEYSEYERCYDFLKAATKEAAVKSVEFFARYYLSFLSHILCAYVTMKEFCERQNAKIVRNSLSAVGSEYSSRVNAIDFASLCFKCTVRFSDDMILTTTFLIPSAHAHDYFDPFNKGYRIGYASADFDWFGTEEEYVTSEQYTWSTFLDWLESKNNIFRRKL